MTRIDAAKRLGVTVASVIQLVKKGMLSERRELVESEGRIRIFYDDAEVENLASIWRPSSPRAGQRYVEKRSERHRQARAIRMFRDRESAWNVAEQLGYTMGEAAELYRQWKMGPDAFLREQEELRLLKDEQTWARDLAKQTRRKEHEAYRLKLAELRKQAPAPIVFVRQDEKGKMRKEEPEEAIPPATGP